jgi:uncharacterized repeat protein (TIGR01451 family)
MRYLIASILVVDVATTGSPPVPAVAQSGVNLVIGHGSFSDPPAATQYTYYVRNAGSRRASNVRVCGSLPPGTEFEKVSASGALDQALVRCITPSSGVRGDIEVRLGSLDAGALLEVLVYVRLTGQPGADVSLRLAVESDEPDVDPNDNSYLFENSIPFPYEPPVIADVTSARDRGLGFIVVVSGTNLSSYAREVGIGCDCTPWRNVLEIGSGQLILFGGKQLRDQFPKGTAVRICVQTIPGGRAVATFTRR